MQVTPHAQFSFTTFARPTVHNGLMRTAEVSELGSANLENRPSTLESSPSTTTVVASDSDANADDKYYQDAEHFAASNQKPESAHTGSYTYDQEPAVSISRKNKAVPICARDSGGTCAYFSCAESRGRTQCVHGKCLCADGYCSDGSSCKESESDAPVKRAPMIVSTTATTSTKVTTTTTTTTTTITTITTATTTSTTIGAVVATTALPSAVDEQEDGNRSLLLGGVVIILLIVKVGVIIYCMRKKKKEPDDSPDAGLDERVFVVWEAPVIDDLDADADEGVEWEAHEEASPPVAPPVDGNVGNQQPQVAATHLATTNDRADVHVRAATSSSAAPTASAAAPRSAPISSGDALHSRSSGGAKRR